MTVKLADRVAALVPKSLDDIVRARRDLCAIRLATAEEIADLHRTIVAPEHTIKGVLSGWRIVCLERCANLGGPLHILVGYSATKLCVWSTSGLTALDEGMGLATTESGSIYRLAGARAASEPPQDELIHLCAMLNWWGWGAILGVPRFLF